MYLEESKLPVRTSESRGNCRPMIDDFLDSGWEVAEVINDGDYRDNNNMRHVIADVLKSGLYDCRVLMINGKVYLERLKHE